MSIPSSESNRRTDGRETWCSRLIWEQLMPDRNMQNDRIIFSVDSDSVWASWAGEDATVRLGSYEAVREMMEEFLAQCDLADRWEQRSATGG